jgi:hypothetical protein
MISDSTVGMRNHANMRNTTQIWRMATIKVIGRVLGER